MNLHELSAWVKPRVSGSIVDLTKRVIQVHAVDRAGRIVARRSLPRDGFMAWCAQLPPGFLVVMEVSSSAHHWARKLIALGLDARIVSAHLAAPYRAEGVTGKNDANDAAGVCEAGAVRRCASCPSRASSSGRCWRCTACARA
jgi:transposase